MNGAPVRLAMLGLGAAAVLAGGGGCAGSTWYRVGEGAVGAGVVLVGFAMGATAAGVGILSPVRTAVQSPALTLTTGGSGAPTLASVVGVPPWIVIAVLAAIAAPWLARARGEPEHGKWPWPATGVAVGLVIALGWWVSAFGGRPTGITFASKDRKSVV